MKKKHISIWMKGSNEPFSGFVSEEAYSIIFQMFRQTREPELHYLERVLEVRFDGDDTYHYIDMTCVAALSCDIE